MKKVFNTIKPYTAPGYLETRGANAVMFKNEGDVTAKIGGLITIEPGQALHIAQVDSGVQDWTQYDLTFDLTSPATTGTNTLLVLLCIGVAAA
jgi:hypothetical protein